MAPRLHAAAVRLMQSQLDGIIRFSVLHKEGSKTPERNNRRTAYRVSIALDGPEISFVIRPSSQLESR